MTRVGRRGSDANSAKRFDAFRSDERKQSDSIRIGK